MIESDDTEVALMRLLDIAWPEGVPAEETALARSLTLERAAIVVPRLAAVLGAEGGRSVGETAAELSMDRIAFFRLRQKWTAQRSIRSLTPFLGRAPRRIGAGRDDDAKLAERLLQSADQPRRLAQIAEQLIRESSGGMSRQTAMRLIRASASGLSTGVEDITRELGAEVLVDLTGTAMSVLDRDGEVAAVCLIVETATRFVLGAATGTASNMLPIIASAMHYAIGHSYFHDIASGDGGRIRLVLPDVPDRSELTNFCRSAATRNVTTISTGERRFGRQLVSLIGHRIGRLSLHPRALTAGVAPRHGSAPARRVSMIDAEALVSEAVRDHNAERCRALLKVVSVADPTAAQAIAGAAILQPEFAFPAILHGYAPWWQAAARLGATISNMEEVRQLMNRNLALGLPSGSG